MRKYKAYMRGFIMWGFVLMLGLQSCEEPYTPELEDVDVAPTLIVDGFIDASGTSRFTISQSVPVNSSGASTGDGMKINPLMTVAQVAIVSEHGQTFPGHRLPNSATYEVDHPALDISTAYFLRLQVGSDVYESAPSRAIQSGDIDDLSFRIVDDERMEILVSSHDPRHSTQYYRWEFEETWKFSSALQPSAILENGQLVDITPETDYGTCYRDNYSSNILIASTMEFSENRIFQKPVQSIPRDSEKLISRYSILVKQYAISSASYGFWELIRKNSEQVGDIFGVMPSEIGGNIRNLNDPLEKVVGFIEVLHPTEKRIFINNFDAPVMWMAGKEIPFYRGCLIPDTLTLAEAPAFFREFPGYLPGQYIYANPTSAFPTHINFAPARCVDCRFYGRKERPEFWID